jgi:acetyl esterase/lipase
MQLPDHRRLAMRSLLALPTPVLRALSGGAAEHRAGRTLDPRLQFISHHAARAEPEAPLGPEEVREAAAAVDRDLLGRIEPGVQVEPLSVPGAAGDLQARLYRPARGEAPEGLVLWFPSGGGVSPGLQRDEPFCSLLTALGRRVVVAVQPRLAPEDRFPAQAEDAEAAWEWARREAAARDLREAAIGGAGFGGGLAAGLCQRARRSGPAWQLLLTPWLDLADETAAMGGFKETWPLRAADIMARAGQVLGADNDPADPRASPARAAEVSGLPPAVIVTAGFDPLADQGERYARRLQEAGAAVTYRRYDALVHDFHAMTGAAPAADAACREVAGLLPRAQGHGGGVPS